MLVPANKMELFCYPALLLNRYWKAFPWTRDLQFLQRRSAALLPPAPLPCRWTHLYPGKTWRRPLAWCAMKRDDVGIGRRIPPRKSLAAPFAASKGEASSRAAASATEIMAANGMAIAVATGIGAVTAAADASFKTTERAPQRLHNWAQFPIG